MYYLLFQSLIAKRPYNLFHRKNLYMRFSDVKRNFGNKTTWDKSFIDHMKKYRKELICLIKEKKDLKCHYKVINYPFDNIPSSYINNVDTIYIDPPYFKKDVKNCDYLKYYHFIEGFVDYDNWSHNIDKLKNNLQLKEKNKFKIESAHDMFVQFANIYHEKNLIISYKTDAYPSIDTIKKILKKKYKKVFIEYIDHKYALSKKK